MKFFDSPDRLKQLSYEACRWLDTPFAPHASVCGAGVDCVHLVAAIYRACGVLAEFRPPKYTLDGGSHNQESQLLAWFNAHPRFARVNSPGVGDALCFNLGLSEHHAGLVLSEGHFIHVLPRRQVIISHLQEKYYSRRITAIYRPMEVSDVR